MNSRGDIQLILLEAPWFNFELDSAHPKLTDVKQGERWPGRSSMAAHEEDHRGEGFRELDLLFHEQIDWKSSQRAHFELRWVRGKCRLGTVMTNGEESHAFRKTGRGV